MANEPNLYERGAMAGLKYMESYLRVRLPFKDEEITRDMVCNLMWDCEEHLIETFGVKPIEGYLVNRDTYENFCECRDSL